MRPSVKRLRAHHLLSWTAIGLSAATLTVACLVPSLEIAIEASIGAGSNQRAFRYQRELALAFDVGWPGPLAIVGGLTLVAAALTGIVIGSKRWLVIASFVVAATLALLVFDTEDQRLYWAGATGVIGYDSPHGGPVLQPALDDLEAEARSSPEARNPGWELGGEHDFSSRGLTAWRIFLWSTLALVWLTGYRVARLALRPWASIGLLLAVTSAVFLWLIIRGLSRLS